MSNLQLEDIKQLLQTKAITASIPILQRFFKTGPGEYGEGDQFIGVKVPEIRNVAKRFHNASVADIQGLFDSPIHEHRLCAAIIMSLQFPKVTEDKQKVLYDVYVQNTYNCRINNWDIIDVTARHVVGAYLENRPRDILFKFAKNDNVWVRRLAILSTYRFIDHGHPTTTIAIAEVLLHDKHDLIHKAVGWMLREVGKRIDKSLFKDFLDQYAAEMPRTMLRYAIERMEPNERAYYLQLRYS